MFRFFILGTYSMSCYKNYYENKTMMGNENCTITPANMTRCQVKIQANNGSQFMSAMGMCVSYDSNTCPADANACTMNSLGKQCTFCCKPDKLMTCFDDLLAKYKTYSNGYMVNSFAALIVSAIYFTTVFLLY